MKTVVTHNSRFHADEVFGCAMLLLLYPDAQIIRTRDKDIIAKGDIVLDVGEIYDPETNRFDHHQIEGAGERANGIPYASCGLIWKHFGDRIVTSKKAWEVIDKILVQPIDTLDTMIGGIDLMSPKDPNMHPYFLQFAIGSFNPTWKEGEEKIDENFTEALLIAKRVLEREIRRAQDTVEGEKFVVEAYEKLEDKSVLVIDGNYPWYEAVANWPEVIFVVKPNTQNKTWKVETVKVKDYSYNSRKDMPKEWAGKTGEELARITGVSDAIFCHKALFLAVAGSKEGAIALAKLAIAS